MTWETNERNKDRREYSGSEGDEGDRERSNYDPQALLTPTEIDHSLNPRPKLTRARSIPIH